MNLVMNDTALVMNGFKAVARYKDGNRTLTFWVGNGQIFSKITAPKRKPFVNFYASEKEANEHFKRMQSTSKELNIDGWKKVNL